MFIYSSQEVLLFTNSISISYICIGEQVKTGLNIEIIMYIEEIIKTHMYLQQIQVMYTYKLNETKSFANMI